MFRVISILFLIITILPVMSCTPPATPFTVPSPTGGPTATGEQSSATSSIPASATETGVPSETATGTSIPPGTSFTFLANADTWVDESNPNEINGDHEELRSDGEDRALESFIRFTVSGISGSVPSARLRVYATNDSRDGPVIYPTDHLWLESEMTWNTRPARTGDAIDNSDRIQAGTWVEYDVTSHVSQDGIFSFVLVADSGDGIAFASRESGFPPELIVTLGENGTATPTLTAPPGAEVLVGAGDISICSNDNDELTAQLLDNIPGTVFTTGDNVYGSGTYTQFMECYDPTWGRHKDRTRPVPGNHDYGTLDAEGYFRYFENIPSYYAYDLDNWRVYALNSEIDVSLDSAQVIWLLADLAANPRQCVVAYWHQPRWSSGSVHGSDESFQVLWEILYRAGAELVINGHDHTYERFAPMNAAGEPDPMGLRAFVVGTGGRSLYGFGEPLPTTEARDNTSYGVLKLILYDSRYAWEFIPATGSSFTDSGSAECH